VKQHQQILRAIEQQDPDAGERAIVAHLDYLHTHIAAHRAG
jgi:GntR family transcriptional regulator, transcriptional repressor for pyruvate dehydrogenase complex